MAEIVADVSGVDSNSYVSLEDMDALMDESEAADDWDGLAEEQRKRILTGGTRKIDRYKNWPAPAVAAQRLTFPTVNDNPTTAIPRAVQNALYAYCEFMARADMDHLKALQAEGVTQANVLGQSATFKADDSELPAGARKELDGQYRRYNGPRVSQLPYDGSGDTDNTTIFG